MATHEGEEVMEDEVVVEEEVVEEEVVMEEVVPAMTEEQAMALAQQLYVAYYGRPADPGGLTFWTGEFMNSSNLDSCDH